MLINTTQNQIRGKESILVMHVQTRKLYRIVAGLAMDGKNLCYLFAGKRVYAEDEPYRYMRLLARFAV